MNRLTNKECYSYEDFVFSLRNKLITPSEIDNAIYKKLKSLENIEEELGIDLITLFKALKGEIYSIHPKTRKICPIILPIFYYCGNQWIIGCHSMEWNAEENSCDNWDCFLKDYGKTWALDMQTLEK